METKLTLEYVVEPAQQGLFLFLPFEMPVNVETLHLSYQYARHQENAAPVGAVIYTSRTEINIIDLGLIAPDGTQVGASGSDKAEFDLSDVAATPGYRPHALTPGAWQILVGAYKVAAGGVKVTYELTFTYKRRRLLKGDLHAHTLASDGVLTVEELAARAVRHGLDFVAITDHNQIVSRAELRHVGGVTLIPGVEWTHYQGHANFLGADRPYDGSFAANTADEIRRRFEQAHERGALIMINHPMDESCGFQLDWQNLPHDVLEIWNGPMRVSNLQAVGLWHSLLAAGRKLPAVGGSDYHRDSPFLFLGGPTTCVFALSNSVADILQALREGHAYITFAPDGPWLEMNAGGALMGETVSWPAVQSLEICAGGLLKGDVLRVVTASNSEALVQAAEDGSLQVVYPVTGSGFVRVEILRSFLPGLPLLPALISNPIYFGAS